MKAFAGKVGDKLKIGVRPEHLGAAADPALRVAGIVDLVERLGETSFAYLRISSTSTIIAEVRGREAPSVGETLTVGANGRDIHVFGAGGARVEAG